MFLILTLMDECLDWYTPVHLTSSSCMQLYAPPFDAIMFMNDHGGCMNIAFALDDFISDLIRLMCAQLTVKVTFNQLGSILTSLPGSAQPAS